MKVWIIYHGGSSLYLKAERFKDLNSVLSYLGPNIFPDQECDENFEVMIEAKEIDEADFPKNEFDGF